MVEATTNPDLLLLPQLWPELFGRYGAEQLVAFGQAGDRTLRQLEVDVRRVAWALRDQSNNAVVGLVFQTDRYLALVALLACWWRGVQPVLPAGTSAESVGVLMARPGFAVMLHDTGVAGHLQVGEVLAGAGEVAEPEAEPTPPRVALYGTGRRTESKLEQYDSSRLRGELEALDQLPEGTFPGPGQRCAVTFPVAYWFGLFAGLLGPLSQGAAISRAMSVGQHIDADWLLSVPEQLHRKPPGTFRGLLCCGGRLSRRGTAWSAGLPGGQLLGTAHGARAFQTVPSGSRQIVAPWLSLGGEEAGALEAHPAERLEAALSEMEEVQDCAAAQDSNGSWLILVATSTGQAATLPRVRQRVERIYPEKAASAQVLCLHRLARDGSGVFTRRALYQHFARGVRGQPLNTELRFGPSVGETRGELGDQGRTVLATPLVVPTDYVWYVGHFGAYPVMAGVVQLQRLLGPLIERFQPDWGAVRSLRRVKFLGRIEPGDELAVELSFGEKQCDFSIARGDQVCSAGRLLFFDR